MNLGGVNVRLGLDMAGFRSGLNTAQSEARGAANGMGGVLRGALSMGIGQLGAQAFNQVTGAMKQGIQMGMSYNAQMEQSNIAFTTMFKGQSKNIEEAQGKAQAFLKDIEHFAAITPFEFPQLTQAASKFMAVGVAAKDVIPLMTAVGDATAGMGTGAAGVERAAYALQQIKLAGRAYGQDMMQLVNAGIPIWDALAAKMGVATSEVKKLNEQGKITSDDVFAAIREYSGPAMQRLKGSMEAQSKSFSGMMSTLKDITNATLGKVVGPLFSGITEQMPKLLDYLGRFGDAFKKGGFKEAFQAIVPKNLVKDVGVIFDRIKSSADKFKKALFGTSGLKVDWAKVLEGAVKKVGAAMKVAEPIIEALGTTLRAVGVFAKGAWDAFSRGVSTMTAGKDAASGATGAFEGVRRALEILSPIVQAVSALLGRLFGFIITNGPLVATAITGITAGFIALKAAAAIGTIIAGVTQAFTLFSDGLIIMGTVMAGEMPIVAGLGFALSNLLPVIGPILFAVGALGGAWLLFGHKADGAAAATERVGAAQARLPGELKAATTHVDKAKDVMADLATAADRTASAHDRATAALQAWRDTLAMGKQATKDVQVATQEHKEAVTREEGALLAVERAMSRVNELKRDGKTKTLDYKEAVNQVSAAQDAALRAMQNHETADKNLADAKARSTAATKAQGDVATVTSGNLGNLSNTIKTDLMRSEENLQKAGDKTSKQLQDDARDVNGALKKITGQAGGLGSSAAGNFASGVASKSGAAKGAGGAVAAGALSGAAPAAGWLNTHGSRAGGSFASGIGSAAGPARSAAGSLATAAKSGAGTAKDGMRTQGSNAGEGFWQGIGSWISRVWSKAYELAQAAVKGGKAGQKSQSPSQEWRLLAEWAGMGYIKGFGDMSGEVNKAAENLVKGALAAGKKIPAKAFDFISSKDRKELLVGIKIDPAGKNTKEAVAKAKKELGEALSKASDKINAAGTKFDMKLAEYSAKARELGKAISGAWGTLGQGFNDWQKQQNQSAKAFTPDNILGNMKNSVDALKKWRVELTLAAKRGVPKELIDQLREAGPESMNQLQGLNAMTADQLKEFNALYKERNKQGQGEGRDAYRDEVLKAYGDLKKKLEGIGKDAMKGLSKGLGSEAKHVRNHLKGLIGDIIKDVKTDLGIRSPSRVFAGIGENMGEGLIVGLKGRAKAVAAMTRQMADMTTAPFAAMPAVAMAGPQTRYEDNRRAEIHVYDASDPRRTAAIIDDELRRRGVI